MNDSMFCWQCEQTANGSGCTRGGVCGKTPEAAALQDLLTHLLKGIGYYGTLCLNRGRELTAEGNEFIAQAAFSTLTNVDFDPDRFVHLLRQAASYRDQLAVLAGDPGSPTPAAAYRLPDEREQMLSDAQHVGVMSDPDLDPDVRSLRETLVYGLRGLGAYLHHAHRLGHTDPVVDAFMYKGYGAAGTPGLSTAELLDLVLELGRTNLRCIQTLDTANTSTFGHPEPTSVRMTPVAGPFIVVSGHDLGDLAELLKQTEGTGVNVYTHGEMLPALAYPELKRYPHLVGNYGGPWQNQQRDFDGLPGAVLMTTNCIQRPKPSYADRIFTTGPAGWPGVTHIPGDEKKDFGPVIARARELGGWTTDEPEKRNLIGFGHRAVLSRAGDILAAVKRGDIRRFVLIGGCDGTRPGRSYYTDLAVQLPQDTVILTLGCGKYRVHDHDYGQVAGLPRLLDLGQCNDAYSAIVIAKALAEALDCGVNDLPLTLAISWYEQKAVSILLTLLSLGITDIRLGPTFPAFLSDNVRSLLAEKFRLTPIGDPAELASAD